MFQKRQLKLKSVSLNVVFTASVIRKVTRCPAAALKVPPRVEEFRVEVLWLILRPMQVTWHVRVFKLNSTFPNVPCLKIPENKILKSLQPQFSEHLNMSQ